MVTKPTVHVLESSEASVSPGVIDPSRAAALTIDSGDVVSYPNTWTQWGNQARFGMSFADREPLRRRFPAGPYSNLGPVEVRGAQPGDVLMGTAEGRRALRNAARVRQTVRHTPGGWRIRARSIDTHG
jgi:hypothetical protein